MMNFPGGSRLANHFSTTTIQNGETVNSDFYFDQVTGMMVEWRQEAIQTDSNILTNSTQMMQITQSSVWAIPEFPLFTGLIVFVFAVSISVIAVLKIGKFKIDNSQSKLTSIR
jgi:hypothetical protein